MTPSATLITPVRPQTAHLSVTFQETQGRYAHYPVDEFLRRDLRIPRHAFVVGPEWAMKTLDNRRADQYFDSKHLQTINEGTEVRFFHPYDTLGYSSDGVDFNVLEEIRQLDMYRHEGFLKRRFSAIKSAVYRLIHSVCNFCRKLFACF